MTYQDIFLRRRERIEQDIESCVDGGPKDVEWRAYKAAARIARQGDLHG